MQTEPTSEPTGSEPRTTPRLIPGDALTQSDDADRWMNEGGSFASEVTAPLRAVEGSR